MDRRSVTAPADQYTTSRKKVGWFDVDAAQCFDGWHSHSAWDISDDLYLTARGRWVLHEWDGIDVGNNTLRTNDYSFITDEQAEAWLQERGHYNEAVVEREILADMKVVK